MRIRNFSLLLAATCLLSACDIADYDNPNAATEQQVLASTDGLLGLAVGTKKEFTVGGLSCLYNVAVADALTTRGLYVINTGNGDLAAVEAGRATLGGSNAITSNLWTSCNIVRRNADLLIENADNIPDAATRSSVTAFGHIMKALAIGTLATFFNEVTTETISTQAYLNGERPTFSGRTAALQEAVQLLTDALPLVNQASVPSAAFTQKVGTGIDLKNTTQALLARYQLMLGNYSAALAAAQAVDLSKRSVWTFDAQNPNPIFRSGLVTANVVGGVAGFGVPAALAPEAGDGRTAFFLSNPNAAVLASGFYTSDISSIPVYLPDEMLLIQAEAYARQSPPQLSQAVDALNQVRTDSDDLFGVNAGLPAYSGPVTQEAVLTEIYRNRLFELYLLGLRLEDSRRFGRPGADQANPERSRNFYPYPQRERDNNASTPVDPAGPLF